jgi:3-oxoacyl-[acyl-carrier-protein] synthase II
MVTPLGRAPVEIWDSWAAGRSAAAPLTSIDFRSLGIAVAAEVSDFEPRKEIKNRKLLRLMIDGEAFGFVAATRAFENAGLSPDDYIPERAGVAIGCHKEGFREENLYDALDIAVRDDGTIDRKLLIEEGIRRIPPQTLVEGLANAALYYFAHEFVLQGVNFNFISSGTGGVIAIGEAMRSIRRDEAEVMLAGAYDRWIDWRCVGHQRFTGVLSTADGPPETIHRSFDSERTGAVAGEGAGMLILEEETRARNRGAEILGEVSGFAMATGASSLDRDAGVQAWTECIRRALDDAGCTPEEIDLVHLHGEATPEGDWIEVHALNQALGDHAHQVPATTIKPVTGLLGNASGPVELVMTLEMLRRGEVLPIVNLQNPDPQFPLNFVREPITGLTLRRALLLQRSWPSHFTAMVIGSADD